VLLVEDNFINAHVIANDLRDVCGLDHARNGDVAIELARRKTMMQSSWISISDLE